jgi:hypothetical protein
MVGQDPSVKGTGSTNIDTRIIPLVFTGSISTTSYLFDPEANDACSPQRIPALNMVQSSPVLKANKLVLGSGGVSLGTYQFGSQFQRANFGTYTIKTASNANPVSPNYNILISAALLNTEESTQRRITIGATTPSPNPQPYTIEGQVQTASDWCDPLALIEVNALDGLLQNQIIPALRSSGLLPTNLAIFLLSNVVMYDTKVANCCILGYHNAYLSQTSGATANKLQTYIVANYDTTGGTVNSGTTKAKSYTGAFPTAPNVVALANMVAGWINNPTTLNPTPSWPASTTIGSPPIVLEVAYPQCPTGLAGQLTAITMPNRFTYSVQDLAFKSWFYDGATSTGFNGQVSMFASLPAANPSVLCPP